jgi:hypothetical protein
MTMLKLSILQASPTSTIWWMEFYLDDAQWDDDEVHINGRRHSIAPGHP